MCILPCKNSGSLSQCTRNTERQVEKRDCPFSRLVLVDIVMHQKPKRDPSPRTLLMITVGGKWKSAQRWVANKTNPVILCYIISVHLFWLFSYFRLKKGSHSSLILFALEVKEDFLKEKFGSTFIMEIFSLK